MTTEATSMENYNKIVARAWTDKTFKEKLLKDPKAALKELGIDVPANITVKVMENDAKNITLVLPAPPKEGDISAAELSAVAGGGSTAACVTTICMCLCA